MSCITKDLLNDLDSMIVLLARKCPRDIFSEWTFDIDGTDYQIIDNYDTITLNTDVYDKLLQKTISEVKDIIYNSTITPPYSYTLYNFLLNLETYQKVEHAQQKLTKKCDTLEFKIEHSQKILITGQKKTNDLYNQINDKLQIIADLLDLKK